MHLKKTDPVEFDQLPELLLQMRLAVQTVAIFLHHGHINDLGTGNGGIGVRKVRSLWPPTAHLVLLQGHGDANCVSVLQLSKQKLVLVVQQCLRVPVLKRKQMHIGLIANKA